MDRVAIFKFVSNMDIEDGENKPLMPRSGQSLRRLSIIVRSSSKSLAAGATLSAVRKWWSVSKLWFSSTQIMPTESEP